MRHESNTVRLHIGAIAQRVGVSPDTVRYYERLGLLPKPARTDSGYRLYSTTDVGRLLFIRRAKLLGLRLSEIQALVGLAEAGECQPVRHRVTEVVQEKLAEIQAALAELMAFKTDLEDRYKLALEREDDSETICATFPTSCDCLPVALHEMAAPTQKPSILAVTRPREGLTQDAKEDRDLRLARGRGSHM